MTKNFITSREKRIDKVYKKLVDPNSMSGEIRKHLKLVGTRPEIIMVLVKCIKNVSMTVHLSDQFYLL